ncbi:MAG: RluA family pseudouridine synthase [Lachnospiraceae bacterium]
MQIEILYEDEEIIVCVKPYGVASQSDKGMDMDMESYLKNYRAKKKEKPEIYVVHRLDRPVAGIMVYAKTQAAAANLSGQIQSGTFDKYYQAVLTGHLQEPFNTLEDYLFRDAKANTSSVVSKQVTNAKRAELEYEVLDELETDEGILTYVLVHLLTGRHHQIRVQMAHAGAPIWGDTKYNPAFQKSKNKYQQIGLFATRLEFVHPKTQKPMIFKADPEGVAFDLIDAEEE